MDDLAKRFGQKVRAARRARSISQEQLALMCGIDRSYMSRIERGIVSTTLEKVYLIVEVLECSLEEILPDPKLGKQGRIKAPKRPAK